MKGELLILFIILLLAFILCSFLGGKECIEGFNSVTNDSNNNLSNDSSNQSNYDTQSNYDNYNHYNKSSSPTIFYGPNGGTAKVIKTLNDNTIVITNKNGTTEIYYIDSNSNDPNISVYHGPNGGSAKLITNNGKQFVEITGPNGSKIIYSGYNIYNQDNIYNDNTNFQDHNGFENNHSVYNNSLPKGIPRSQIPSGQEDLYILKSQVVPPVCPKCPNPIVKCPTDTDVTKCPPCPPCARCPEPSFTCAKIPNYSAFNQNTMPVPVLSDFSTFGM